MSESSESSEGGRSPAVEPEHESSGPSSATRARKWVHWLVGVAVFLLVAAGILAIVLLNRRPAVVPDLRLQTAEEAVRLLEDANLRLGDVSELATQSVGPGRVVTQTPEPLARPVRDTTVDLWIAVAPSAAKVPDLADLQAGDAIEELTAALFLPYVVNVFDLEEGIGTVVAQVPDAGAEWTTGRPVAIAVAAGPDDGTGVTVPNVEGVLSADASATLTRAGLSFFAVIGNPNTVQFSTVRRQLPEAGVLVSPGTTVLLLYN